MPPDAADERRLGPVDCAVEKNLKPEQTAASKVASLDWKRSLLETFASQRARQPEAARLWHLWAI
jgi:hypothetical protein